MVWGSLFGGEATDGVCMSPKPKSEATTPKDTDADMEKTVEEAYECDYERDCTPLYRAIENALQEADFDPIVKFLDTGYWSPSFFSDPITPADQAKTWVTRFDDVDPNKVKWSQLPLHLAIVCGAPPSIIGRLVRLYPQALRCTDDQHMLPLHLALRHGSDDEIIAFLLMKFPDAVNAKGKNGRTAVECALRAKDKLRGKILEMFVEKTRGRRAHGVIQEHNRLKADLTAKDAEIEELRADLEGMSKGFEELRALKGTTEQDLLMKIQEAEQAKADMEMAYEDKLDRLQSEKMLESIQFQKKLEAVMESNAEIELAEKQLRQEEAELRYELEKMQSHISNTVSPEDMDNLKKQMDELRTYRLERTRSATKGKIDNLKEELHKTIENTHTADEATKDELRAELKALRKTVEKLEKTGVSAKTTDEMNILRDEVENLRNELKERSEANKTKSELSTLKKSLEAELNDSKGKTKEELAALRKAIMAASVSESDTKTLSELATMKQELETMKKDMKNKELINKTKKDLDDFRNAVAAELEEATDSKTRVSLTTLQKSADQLEHELKQCNSGSQVVAVKKTIDDMKTEVKKKSLTNKIVADATQLKASVESCIKNSEGKTFDDLAAMKKALKALNEKELSNKSVDELNDIKISLADIRKDLKDMNAATQIMLDLHAIKKSIAVEIKGMATKTDKEIAMMKIAIDAVNMDHAEGKELKKSLGAEIKQNNTMIAQELSECKQNLDDLDVKKLDRKDKSAWDNVRSEIKEAKELLDSKQSTKDTVKAELEIIRKTAEDKKRSEAQFISLREVRFCLDFSFFFVLYSHVRALC